MAHDPFRPFETKLDQDSALAMVRDATAGGAKGGHRWTKAPDAWQPIAAPTSDGGRTAAGVEVAEMYGKQFG